MFIDWEVRAQVWSLVRRHNLRIAMRNDFPDVTRTNEPGIEHAFSWAAARCICSLVCAAYWSEPGNVWPCAMVLPWRQASPSGTAWCLFSEGVLVLTAVELGSGSRNCIAENITETSISNAWHFVINSIYLHIYLHISSTTVQANWWAESWNHFLKQSSSWYQRSWDWK